jgi:hypothetical protein
MIHQYLELINLIGWCDRTFRGCLKGYILGIIYLLVFQCSVASAQRTFVLLINASVRRATM